MPLVTPIVAATGLEQIEQVRILFQEYWDSFDFTPCFQNFSAELAALPGDYAPPRGALGLLLVADKPAGCAALRPLDSERCEFKRLYLRNEFRAQGLGKLLLDWVIAQARALGYRELFGDTMPQMSRALDIYARAGFERIPPYSANPTPGAICLRLALSP